MTNNKCMECENEAISDLASMTMERDKYKRYYELTCKCLDVKDELCKALREENQDLIYKLELFNKDK